ncbi:MAG: diguanylate cyclase, partial [Thermoanaerobaculia bacterium]
EQIADRYTLYGTLAALDAAGALVAAATPKAGPVPEVLAALEVAGSDQLLIRQEGEVRFAARQPVRDAEGSLLGYLIAVCSLDDLWKELTGGPYPDSYELRALDADGVLLFETDPGAGGRAWDLLRRQPTAEYRRHDGRAVLGALRFLDTVPAAILVETDRDAAFAPIYRLRDFTLWVSVVASLLVAAVGCVLVINLTRPIEALIEGAKAAARGDLSQEIPVSSQDQIGYLTTVFNRMMRTVRESRARLELLSSLDALTSLLNRRALDNRFETELDRARRLNDPLSVLMIDLDGFKAFNDRHGHQAGDEVLRFLGSFLFGCLRSIDVAARYGGEEFLVLLPGTDGEGAAVLAERLRLSFKQAHSEQAGAVGPVTLSVGVATFPADGATADELVRAADSALYRAKHDGRDRVSVASDGKPLRAVWPADCVSTP